MRPLIAALVGLLIVSGCDAGGAETQAKNAGRIGLLLAGADELAATALADKIENQVQAQCGPCELTAYHATGAQQQSEQLDELLDLGVGVVLIEAADPNEGEKLAASAHSSGAQVVALRTFIQPADYYLAFDAAKTGELQMSELSTKMLNKGGILVLTGARADRRENQTREAFERLQSASNLTPLADPSEASSAEDAEAFVAGQIERLGAAARIKGIYASTDEQAKGAIAALLDAGVPRKRLPPVTGAGADLDAVRRVVSGQQLLTIYESRSTLARETATLISAIATSKVPDTGEYEGVAAVVVEPVALTQRNVMDTVVKDGVFKIGQICAGDTQPACARIGLG